MEISKKYQKLTHIQHILKRPGMYIGTTDKITSKHYIWDEKEEKIKEKEINYSPGMYKIFDEIIVNSYDQTIRDKTVSKIKVSFNDKGEISIYNDGKGIDVVMHPKEKIYVPELIFGHLMTSSTFDESKIRITGGIHGLGAKLTAIYSTKFKVEIGDSENKKEFIQEYKKNLSIKSKPIIRKYDKKTGYVKITFTPDFKYFKTDGLDDDILSLMKRRVYDLCALTDKKISIYLNNIKLNIKSIEDYVLLSRIEPIIKELCSEDNSNYKKNRWKIYVTKSDGEFKQISFVNGIYTSNGGYHVNYILNKILKGIKHYIQAKYKTNKIKDQFIKDQINLFIFSVIENPTFSSQTKDELMTPVNKFGSTCEFTKKFVTNIINKLNLDEIIKNEIDKQQHTDLIKLDVKKKSVIKGIKKLYDANNAGTKKSNQCVLILTEGDSAKTMAISGLSAIPKANNYYGVFPLKGKLLNVREASHKQIVNNEEFKNIKTIMGLTMNKKYSNENLDDLRYGSVLLMMDADVDGSHIKGLFMNMMEYYWPSLLQIDGFVKIFITPIVKVSKNDKILSFYNLEDYNKWKKKVTDRDVNKWKIKYYKGLGTNTSNEAKDYFSKLEKHILKMIWTNESQDAIELAFSKQRIEDRKSWLKKYDKNISLNYTKIETSYNDFIHKELIHFSNYDNIRSIPNLIDGLKPSQRKVLYSTFKRDLKNDIKVAQFVGYVSEHTSYHHGEISLAKTIIGMAQNFVGSNNINLLSPKGQFGTRILGGKDHSSPRYIYTQLEKLTRLIFRKDDDELLKYLDDDGYLIEPEYYIPIIPILLINGSEGIGTGYSTYIPKYNPNDIINYIKNKLNGKKKQENLKPWYNNFKGSIIKLNNLVYHSKGIYNKHNNKIIINELPIGTWTDNYKIYLDDLMSKHKFIKSIKNNSNEKFIEFIITFDNNESILNLENINNNGFNGLEKFFSLVSAINLSNMHLYNHKLIINKYPTVSKIIDEFYDIRLSYYDKRKIHMLNKINNQLKIINSKKKFIEMIIKNKLKILNMSQEKILKLLDENKFHKFTDDKPYDYLIKMPFITLSKENIDNLNSTYNIKKKEYDILKNKTIERLWLDDLEELELNLANFNTQ